MTPIYHLHPADEALLHAHAGPTTLTAVITGERDAKAVVNLARRRLGRRAKHNPTNCRSCATAAEAIARDEIERKASR